MVDFYNGLVYFHTYGLLYPQPLYIGIALLVVTAIFSYLLGSINFAVLISKKKFNEDIRNYGSGNGGMTNMMRTYGRGAAVMTFIGDMAKAFVAVWLGITLYGIIGGYVAGLFCIIGHCFPVFFHFHGGKGVATAAMTILCLSPTVCLVLFIIFVIIVAGYKYISLGSVMCMLLYPVILSMMKGTGIWNIGAVLISLIIIFMHRENIKRLFRGEENKFKFRKKGERNAEKEEK